MVVDMNGQLSSLVLETPLGDGFFGRDVDLDVDFASGLRDRDLVYLGASNLWGGTRGNRECIFGAIRVVFLVRDLVCSYTWCYKAGVSTISCSRE